MNRSERNSLVVENLPLVGYLVSEVCAKATHLSRDDLASAGAVALTRAADEFDPTFGVPFGGYARKRILGAITDEMRGADWATRGARTRIKAALSVNEKLTATLGRAPTLDETAEALGVDRPTAAAAMADASRSLIALDDAAVDFLHSSEMSPEDAVLVDERTHVIRQAVAALPERMRHIVEQVYFNDRTVTELADEMGLTHSAVSHHRSEAMRLLRDGIESHYADTDAPAELVPHSRVAPSRREGFLVDLGERIAGGITRQAPAALVARAS